MVRRPSQDRIAVALSVGLLASLLNLNIHAQSYPAQYVATVWQTEQGLPQNSVHAIVQDQEGYLWLGTWGGLARFDGVRFKVFGSADIPGLGSGRILALYRSRSGALWIGTRDGSVTRWENGVAVTYGERDGLPGRLVNSIREDREGTVWINASGGVARFTGAGLERYAAHHGRAVSQFYLQAQDGSMWFRSGDEIVRFGADGSMAALRGGFLVHEARDGSVWVALQDPRRLVRYYQGEFRDVLLPPIRRRQWAGQYREQGVLAMATDTDGELLLLTADGLIRVVGGSLSPPETLAPAGNADDLPKVLSLMVDREGNRWVGTLATGLFRFRPAPLSAFGKDEGLSDSLFQTVFQDSEGRVWLGGDSLYWFDGRQFHLFPGLVDVRAIAQTRNGDLWFGGSGGLYRWRSGELSRFRIDAPAVNAIHEDRDGAIWVVAPSYERPGGLYRFRNEKFEHIAADVHRIAEDKDGGLWLASRQGLERMHGGKTVLYKQPLFPVPDLYPDSTGTFWIANYGEGLVRFRDGNFKSITTRNGLPNETPVALLDDGKGSLWVSSDRNIFRHSLKELNDFADGKASSISPVSYGIAEGMRSSECDAGSPGVWKTKDGRIWFPTIRGVVAIDPDAGSRQPPTVVLEEAWANNIMLGRGGRSSAPAGNNTFDFHFTATSLSAADKQRFKYRLEPFDKEWVDAGARRTAHYTNMVPGEYTFHVIAANSFGIWSEKGAVMRFVLQPHYYQTNLFYAFCTIAFFGLLWAAYQYRLRQLQRAFNMRLEERVGERTRIARELHDTLLQSFQGSLYRFQAARNLFSRRPEEAIKTLESAITSAEDALAEGRDAIRNLRVAEGERRLEDLLTSAGQELRATPDGNAQPAIFQVTVEGQPRPMSPLLQDEVYRIAREVLRNAFQHAAARRIEAAVQYDPDLFRLRIRDDGKGIDPKVLEEGARPGHWGLPGIRERAKQIGARLQVWSESGAGTEIELTVPASAAYAGSAHQRRFGLFRIKKQAL